MTLGDMKAGPDRRRDQTGGRSVRQDDAQADRLRDALDRLIPDMGGEGVRNADLIIEAVPEKLELKQKVYAGIEPRMKAGAILATNTSSIPLQDLRTTLKNPSGWSASTSSIRCRACSSSRSSAMTQMTRGA